MAQFEVEKKEHEIKMRKMEQEMEEVFEMKVQEKMQKLREIEADVRMDKLILEFVFVLILVLRSLPLFTYCFSVSLLHP